MLLGWLTRLKLTAVRDQLDSLLDEAARRELTLREALAFLCERETARKDERRIAMAVKIAHFPCVRDLDGSNPRILVRSRDYQGDFLGAIFSPDGTRFVYERSNSPVTKPAFGHALFVAQRLRFLGKGWNRRNGRRRWDRPGSRTNYGRLRSRGGGLILWRRGRSR